jgi:hypothetical protein
MNASWRLLIAKPDWRRKPPVPDGERRFFSWTFRMDGRIGNPPPGRVPVFHRGGSGSASGHPKSMFDNLPQKK